MLGPKAWWNQHFHLLPDKFDTGMSEQLLALHVREHNTTLLIDDKHSIGGGVEDGPEVGFNRYFHWRFRYRRFYTW